MGPVKYRRPTGYGPLMVNEAKENHGQILFPAIGDWGDFPGHFSWFPLPKMMPEKTGDDINGEWPKGKKLRRYCE